MLSAGHKGTSDPTLGGKWEVGGDNYWSVEPTAFPIKHFVQNAIVDFKAVTALTSLPVVAVLERSLLALFLPLLACYPVLACFSSSHLTHLLMNCQQRGS